MLRTIILAAAALVATAGSPFAATPWVEGSLGFTTYDLSDVNDDLANPLHDLGLRHGREVTIDDALLIGAGVGVRLGRWSVGVYYDRLSATSEFDQSEPVSLDTGQLTTDALTWDADAQAVYLGLDRHFGEPRDNPRVVYGVAAGAVFSDGSLSVDLRPQTGEDPMEYRATTGFSGAGFYGDAHLRVDVDLGRVYIAPSLAYRYAAIEVDDFDPSLVLDGDDEPIFTLDTLDYTGMVFRVGVGYRLGR